MIVDPVCGMHVDPENAPASAVYKEHTFYFCSDTCRDKFLADAEQFAQNAAAMNPQAYGDCRKAA